MKHTAMGYPGRNWESSEPESAGMSAELLERVGGFMGGRGCIARYGYMVYTWGDITRAGDVASAAKPLYAHFLFNALQEGLVSSFDVKACIYAPGLKMINKDLGFKDREITLRHKAAQTSCYGVVERPGTAYCYNDWQMALFWDILFLQIYKAGYHTVDEKVLKPKLTDLLQCEDAPSLMAFGTSDRPGRLAISPRDFARFGLLYLNAGKWRNKQLMDAKYIKEAVSSPLSPNLPRAGEVPAEMLPGQRSIGSKNIPDNQNHHQGSYSLLWWVNGG